MIKYHPTEAVLAQFSTGDLPASVSVVVASHVEMCPQCQAQVAAMTARAAQAVLDDPRDGEHLTGDQFTDDQQDDENGLDSDDLAMLDRITELEIEPPQSLSNTAANIEVAGLSIPQPRALKSVALKEWQGIGKLSRCRLALDDQQLRASLLHIEKGGSIPSHTHKGFEITLLLQGSFDDEMGHYQAGDFIWLDGEHTHNPVTEEGCICLTVSSDAIHFTQGMSQLFNPIGKFIY